MPDICSITGDTITCVAGVDWLAVFSAIAPAVIGVGAAILATWLANSHHRSEASKQRKIVQSAAIMRAAFNMLRSSYRNKEEMRDHASELEISIRILSVELQTTHGQAFVRELDAWRRALVQDCHRLPQLPLEADPNTEVIRGVRRKTDAFVEYLDDWLHVPDRQLGDYSGKMKKAWIRLWPDIDPPDRTLPQLGGIRGKS